MTASTRHGLVGVADAVAFLARLVRFDAGALVRLRRVETAPGGAPCTALWGRLPWDVLVTRTVAGSGPGDATVAAGDLLAGLREAGEVGLLPARVDQGWRWSLPHSTGRAVEYVPREEILGIARAAAGTLRTVASVGLGDGRPIGGRALRDALLDHVAIVVTTDPPKSRIEVTQRLIQAVVRMGFLAAPAAAEPTGVRIRAATDWVGVAAAFGTAWQRKAVSLVLRPAPSHTNVR